MAKFGQYEMDRPLYRTGFNAIYLRQPTGKGSRRCIIKAYQPSVRVRDKKLAAAQSDAFLDSAAVQKKAALEDARHWAPIHESGVSPEGVFYITDVYDLSAQQLIDGRVNLGATGLCRMVESVIKGLLALKRACGRPHGNLKFTNILIAKRKTWAKEKIVLSDPCPSSQLDEDTHAKMDLRQIGTLIHQVATHRNPPLVAGYQAPDSPEWQKLGRCADAWRGLCNRLLTMDVEARPITLEELAAELPRVAARGRNRMFKIVAGVCIVILLAVLYRPVTGVVMNIFWPPDPEEVRLSYQQCSEAQNWLRPLWYKLADKVLEIDKQRYAYWIKEEESIRRLVGLIQTYGEPFKASETDLVIPASPPEKLATSRGYQRDIIAANDARRQIEGLLFGDARRWSLPKELAARATGLREARGESMAGYMDTLLGSIQPHEELAERIDDVLYLKNNWYEVKYADLEPNAVAGDPNLTATVQSTRDFVDRLHRLPGHYRQEISAFAELLVAEGQLRDLLKEMIASGDTEAETLQVRLETRVQPRIAQIRSTPFTKANERRVTDECRLARDLLGEIEQQIKGADQWFDDWRAEARNGICSSSAINSAYVARLDAWIGQDRSAFVGRYQGRWRDLRLVRDKVQQTRENLRRLDSGLPGSIAAESASGPWSDALCGYYASTKREDLAREITNRLAQDVPPPDPNDYPDECRKLLDWPNQAMALMRDFADIETGLNNCHMLDETPPGARANIESLYDDPANRRILDDGSVRQILAPVTARLEELERIRDTVNDIDSLLAETGISPQLEGRVAAWRKLVSLPLVEEKWQEEEGVRDRLKTELESRRRDGRLSETRWSELAQEIDKTGMAREREFMNVSVDRLAERVAAKAGGVVLLEQLGQFKPANDADLSEIRTFHASLKSLWDNDVNSADWPAKYDLGQFDKDHASQADRASVVAWLSEISQYRRIEDRRDTLRWDEMRSEVNRSIDEGLGDAAADPNVKTQLAVAKTAIQVLEGEFETIRGLPAIEKQRAEIEQSSDLWRRLQEMEERVNSVVHPAYKYLAFRNGAATFKEGLGLDEFEPVDLNFARFARADLRDEFFETVDRRDKQNAGWPKFIRARADDTVILGYVPGDAQAPPFYISQREITNKQYMTFLASTRRMAEDFILGPPVLDHDYNLAIEKQNLLSKEKTDHPVVWITYEGAGEYASWLGAQLPEKSWHERAAARNDLNPSHYRDPRYYHVRAKAWWDRAEEYNKKLDSFEPLSAPLGAADGLDSDSIPGLEPVNAGNELPAARQEWNVVWPTASIGGRIPPGDPVAAFYLFDLIGNVWEWCRDDDPDANAPICGGSCLSGLEHAKPESTFDFPKARSACDVGFRTAVMPTTP